MPTDYWESVNVKGQWQETLAFYDGSGNLEYMCKHMSEGAATSDTGWWIVKYSYTGGNFSGAEGPREGSVDNRASLNWR